MSKSVKVQLMEAGVSYDSLSKKSDGTFIIRKGFFYTHGRTAQNYADELTAKIPTAKVIAQGEEWKPFRGGASVTNQSHWWVQFELASA